MALTDQEKEIIKFGKENGKTLTETKAALVRFRQTAPAQATQATSTPAQSGESKPFMQKAGNVLGNVFGGNVIGQAIGNQIAKGTFGNTIQKAVIGRDLSTEEESLVGAGPTGKQVAGDALRAASNLLPVGKIASIVTKGAKAIGIGRGADLLGQIGAGTTVGVAADIGASIAEGDDASLGLGTAIGFGLPASSPLVSAVTRATGKLVGRAGSEVTGALTGTSQETVEQAYLASRAGGKQLEEFTKGLRGKTTPEALINDIRNNIDVVSQTRSQLFSDILKELGDNVVSTAPAKQQFARELEETGIVVKDGILDFSNSKLRTVPAAQAKLQQAFMEVSNMPGSATLSQIDTTRQAVKGIKSIAGDEPSANLANMLIDDAVRSIRTSGEQVEGYGKMLDEFGETSEFLNELNKGLMSGDKTTVDQAYRRLTTSLKTNNEQRAALVKELDMMTDGAVLSGVAGQQLSEVLPRGIFRQILAGSAGVSVITGSMTPAIIPTLVFASPRAVGEMVRALGLGASKTNQIIDSVSQARELLIKAGAITGAEIGIEAPSNLE